jgi:hypothetical protein
MSQALDPQGKKAIEEARAAGGRSGAPSLRHIRAGSAPKRRESASDALRFNPPDNKPIVTAPPSEVTAGLTSEDAAAFGGVGIKVLPSTVEPLKLGTLGFAFRSV